MANENWVWGATPKCALGVKDAIKGLLPAAGSAYEEAVGMVTAGLSGIGSATLQDAAAKRSRWRRRRRKEELGLRM